MEQHIGHQTFYRNLRTALRGVPQVQPNWVEVSYYQPGGMIERLPMLPNGLRGTLRGMLQAQRGSYGAYEVAFYHTQVAAVLAGAAFRKRPYVVSTDITPIQYDRMASYYGHRPDRGGPIAALKHRINVLTLRRAKRVLAWSTWVRRSLIDDYGVALNSIEILPPGVDTSVWRPILRDEEADHPLRILFVGGDLARKGGDTLLAAFHQLPPGSAELWLVTRSPAPQEPHMRCFHGLSPNDPQLIELFQTADLFVLPTEAEAFGIAALEASAAGLPVIATNVGGLPDIVADGETGFLIQPGDVHSLVSSMRLLSNDPARRRAMGLAGRARVEVRFDAQVNARRLVAVLGESV